MNYSYKMPCHLANLVGPCFELLNASLLGPCYLLGLLGSDHFGGMLEIFQRVDFVDHS